MEAKKNPKADMERKRGIFLEIGLIAAFSLVIAVFSAGTTQKNAQLGFDTSDGAAVFDYELPDPIIEKKPPVPDDAKKVTAVLVDFVRLVDNNTMLEEDYTFPEFVDVVNLGVVSRDGADEVIDEADVYVSAEQMPTFQGGDLNTFRAWVQKRLVYPEQAKASGIQGKVTLQFVIERDGSLSSIEMLRTPDSSLSEEVIRVLKTSPKWEPGRQRNQPVRIKFTLPIDFVLN